MKRISFLLLVIIWIGCGNKGYYHPNSFMPVELNIDSEILEYHSTLIADTTLVFISGKIYGKSIMNNDTLVESLSFSNIQLKDLKTDLVIGTSSNKKGDYELTIPASRYEIEVSFIGFKSLKIQNIEVGTGQIIDFSAILGGGYGKTLYEIDSLNIPIKLN